MSTPDRAPKLELVLDMETSDPDDFLTLLLLLGHPRVRLRGVTVTPGTPAQIGLVRRALSWFAADIPVGAFNIDHPKECVSAWHYHAYGPVPPSRDAAPGPQLLRDLCDERTTLLTGAPLRNLGAALRAGGLRLGRLVAQGGFAGEGVVPTEQQLAKFRGRVTCPSFNLNGDPAAVLLTLHAPEIGARRFVSKNVCHGVAYDAALHQRVAERKGQSRSLALIHQGMEHYLRKHPQGKLFHDPLAACCAIDDAVGTFAEVELYRERGEWGARLQPGTRTWIITAYDHQRFLDVLLAA